MLFRKLTPVLPLLVAAGFASCSGGSASKSSATFGTCADGSAFCLVSCNLGCTSDGGCAVSDIAENQPLEFIFNKEIDPRTVNFSTITLKSTGGEEPVGTFVVNGSRLTFVPEVRTVQGATFFGFASNETYILSITGGDTAPLALLSTDGQRIAGNYNCTLRTTLGIVDLDQRPPSATFITPATLSGVSRDTNVVIQFSEMIDFGPFQGVSGEEAPIVFRVRRTRTDNGVVRCDASSRAVVLSGSPRLQNDAIRGVTIATYQPPNTLPADSCLEVEITSRVRDLAGTRAVTEAQGFVIESGDVQEIASEFDFENDLELDLDRSSGSWSGGRGVFGRAGGDGRHGDFDVRAGERITDTHYRWNTDSMTLPKNTSGFLGSEVTVTGGTFYFSNFWLPAGFTLEFVGSHPAHVFVRGSCLIEGRILSAGGDVAGTHDGSNSIVSSGVVVPGRGQAGGVGGAGGGAGGDGAWACDGNPANPPPPPPGVPDFHGYNGYDGEPLVLPAGHAYTGSEVDTGGRGGLLFPSHGNQTLLIYRGFGGIYAIEAASGAGGGGYVTAGGTGTVPFAGAIQPLPGQENTNPAERGPESPGGVLFPLLQFPGSFVSSNYFVIGGSGGGGGGSHPLFAQSSSTDAVKYRSGAAGGGGGGAMLMRSGRDVSIASSALLDFTGGACEPTASALTISSRGVPVPGGGGSGGSVVLQIGGDLTQSGSIDVRGGIGARDDLTGFFSARILGGDGSPGFVRIERAGAAPTLGDVGTLLPAPTTANLGVMTETDTLVGFQSLWRNTGEAFPPVFVRYEIDVELNGNLTTFSDDAAHGARAIEGAPVVFWVQGAELGADGQPKPDTALPPWRRNVGSFGTESGMNSDAPTGFRWILLFDRNQGFANAVVRSVRVYYRA